MTDNGILKKAIEHALYDAMDSKKIRGWYYNGKYHVTTDNGTFTLKIVKEAK